MKHIKLYRTKEQAIGQVIETPAIIMANTQTAFAPQSLGKKIELSQDENGELIVSIYEEELPEGEIDLGLPSGLKWASCNIGASKPCEPGLLFQFGRVDGYAYDDPLHQFRTNEQNIEDNGNSYVPLTTSDHYYDNGDVLIPADDAAYVATNGKLRMPTIEEIDELLANTTSQWCMCKDVLGADHTSHNVHGRLFTSKTDTSKKIFIPAAGCFGFYSSFCNKDESGIIWSSSVNPTDNWHACALNFYDKECNRDDCNYRAEGYSVRGVCKEVINSK